VLGVGKHYILLSGKLPRVFKCCPEGKLSVTWSSESLASAEVSSHVRLHILHLLPQWDMILLWMGSANPK